MFCVKSASNTHTHKTQKNIIADNSQFTRYDFMCNITLLRLARLHWYHQKLLQTIARCKLISRFNGRSVSLNTYIVSVLLYFLSLCICVVFHTYQFDCNTRTHTHRQYRFDVELCEFELIGKTADMCWVNTIGYADEFPSSGFHYVANANVWIGCWIFHSVAFCSRNTIFLFCFVILVLSLSLARSAVILHVSNGSSKGNGIEC